MRQGVIYFNGKIANIFFTVGYNFFLDIDKKMGKGKGEREYTNNINDLINLPWDSYPEYFDPIF